MTFALWCVAVFIGGWMWSRLNRRLLGDSLSPFNLLLFSWLVPLALSMLSLSGLQRPWGTAVWLVIVWCTVALVGVSAAASTRVLPRPLFAGVDVRPTLDEWSSPQLLAVLVSLYAVGFAGYLYNEFITNPIGIPAVAYFNDPLLSRGGWHRWGKTGGTSPAGLVAVFVPMLLPSLYLVSRRAPSRAARRMLVMAVAAYPVMSLLKLSRIDVITSMASVGMAEFYRRAALRRVGAPDGRPRSRKFRQRVVLVALVLSAAPLSNLFLQLRANVDVAETYFERTLDFRLHLPSVLQGFALEGYSYFALPYENLADWVTTYSGPDLPGVGSLRPVYSLVGRGRDMDVLQESAIGDYRLWPINTYPFITLPYFEFGALSVVVYPLFVALVANFFYVRMRAAPTALGLVLYINCMYGWLLLFSANGFSVLTFYINIAGLVAVYTLARLLRAVSSGNAAAASHARA